MSERTWDAGELDARVIHGNVADKDKHAAMGFEEGWGKALGQLVEMARG